MGTASASGRSVRRGAAGLLVGLVVAVPWLGLAACQAPTAVLAGRLDLGAGAGASATVVAEPTGGAPTADPARVRAHLAALQEIADREGGTRMSGSPGAAASEAHAVATLEDAGWAVTVQPFTHRGWIRTGPPALAQVGPVPATYVADTDFALTTPPASGGAEAPLALVGITGVPDAADGSTACEAGAFDAFPDGAIALVVHGACDPWAVMVGALVAGATGVGFISDATPGEQDPVQVDLGLGVDLPSFSVSHALGVSLVEQVRTAGTVTVRVDSGWRRGTVTTANVVAERPGTDPSRVLLLGGHLDSVRFGPGINDNGSGVAALLALAEAWGASGAASGPTLRIGLWGAEEAGMLGSAAYVDGLSATDRASITAYLNFDMLGSRNGFPFVYDPAVASDPASVSPGSAALTERFERYFDAVDIPTDGIWTDGRSDDRSFALAGIPVGGLGSGAEQPKTDAQAGAYGGTAGEAYDVCYHLACDRLDGVDLRLLDQLTAGLSAVVAELAAVPVAPTTTTTSPPSTSTSSSSSTSTPAVAPSIAPVAKPVAAAPALAG